MKKYIFALIIISLAACGKDEIKPNEQAKSIKPSHAIILDSPTYNRDDIEVRQLHILLTGLIFPACRLPPKLRMQKLPKSF